MGGPGQLPLERVRDLLAKFSGHDACVTKLLCDDRESSQIAYRIVSPELTVEQISYGELRFDSERLASALHSLGLRQGDRIATLMGKSREYLVTLLAIWRLGAVQVPLFTAFAPPAIALRLRGSGTKAIICDAAQFDKMA